MHPTDLARLARRALAAVRRGSGADAWEQLRMQHDRQLELAQHLRRQAAELAVERRLLQAAHAAASAGTGDHGPALPDAAAQDALLSGQQQRLSQLADEVSAQGEALAVRIASLRAGGAGADALVALERARADADAASQHAREALDAATSEVDAARAYAQALQELREDAPPAGS